MKTLSKEQLTAYALEEITATERAELEALLAASPEDQTYAEETREFCQLLQGSIGGNTVPATLTDAQKQAIAKTIPFAANPAPRKRWPIYAFGTAAAAAVAVWLAMPYFPKSNFAKLYLPESKESLVASEDTRADKLREMSKTEPISDLYPLVSPVKSSDPTAEGFSYEDASEAARPEALYAATPIAGPATEPRQEISALANAEVRSHAAGFKKAPIAPAPQPGGGDQEMEIPKKPPLIADLGFSASPVPASDFSAIDSLADEGRRLGRSNGGASGGGYGDGVGMRGKAAAASLSVAEGLESQGTRYYLAVPETEPLAQQADAKTDESYIAPAENPYRSAAAEPLSTFSIDVDTASYANVRRFLNMGQRPPAEAVRLEELVNYFRYDYPAPAEGKPCSITADLVSCPWNENHRLARVGLKARTDEKRPNANLVFLLDVSGSMNEPNKLPLVKKSLHLLVDKLTENDRVSIVVYAGASGLVLPPTHGENKKAILGAIDNLQPGGSTNGASGITLAYEEARKAFIKDGVNRVILATDGDFNVGISDRDGLQSLIEKEAKSGVFLSVLGYGMGNLKDSTMEVLADKGNGNYAYIDSLGEARKVLAEEMSSTLVTVAKDVKVQIDFNPAKVRSYRLLGYENRMLAKEDFNNDKKDAGEMGAGHTVTALYEIIPADAPLDVPAVDPSKYQTPVAAKEAPPVVNDLPDSMTVKVRYKAPDADVSQLMELPVIDQKKPMAEASGDTKFATAVAGYALLLKGSNQAGNLNWAMVRELAKAGKGADAEGYRGEFMGLVDKAEGLVR